MTALIVVAEDDDSIRSLLIAALEGEGYRVIGASDGAMALDLVERTRPDLLLTDNMMPKLRGEELIAQLHAHGGNAPAIILISALAPAVVPATARSLAKPFDLLQLFGLVRGLLAPA